MIKPGKTLFTILFISILTLLSYSGDIFYLELDGVINPVTSEFVLDSIDIAEHANAECLIILLDTPGGLDENMREIIKGIMSSTVPVIVYVSPSGARAASAGTYITMSAHIAVMAPGTNIGAATPVLMNQSSGKQEEISPEMKKKMVNDAVAYLKSLAEKRNRDTEWIISAVKEGESISSEEALERNVVDLIAADMNDLIKKVNGREVNLPFGNRKLSTTGRKLKEIKMNFKLNFLKTLTNPNLAYLLFLLGLLGIYIEVTHPGGIFPGVVGGLSIVLALYAFNVLPVNTAGILLIVLAFILFILEIKVVSYGMLTVGGIVSLFLGSIFLMNKSVPYYQVSLGIIIPTVVLVTIAAVVLIYLAAKAQTIKVTTSEEGMVGEEGRVTKKLEHDLYLIRIRGEYWRAESFEKLEPGEKVLVTAIRGLMIQVEKVK